MLEDADPDIPILIVHAHKRRCEPGVLGGLSATSETGTVDFSHNCTSSDRRGSSFPRCEPSVSPVPQEPWPGPFAVGSLLIAL